MADTTPDKAPQKHASLLAVLMHLTIEKMLQSKQRGETFLEPLETVLVDRHKACTTPDEREAWMSYLRQVRGWRRTSNDHLMG